MLINLIKKYINHYHKISAFIAGILCSLAYAPLFFTPGLIGFSVIAYLIYSASTYKEALSRNLAFGFGFFGYGLYWIVIGISVYIEDFWWAIPISLLGLPLMFSILTSLPTYVAWKLRQHKYYILIYSLAWTFAEWISTWIFTGFPWMLVGYTAAFSDILSQLASVCGVLGISFIIFNITTSFYYMWQPTGTLLKHDIFYMVSVLGLASLFGVIRLEQNPTKFLNTTIRIIQPSIPQIEKWNAEIFWQNLDKHAQLSHVPTHTHPDITLWSEAAVTAPIQLKVVRDYLNHVAHTTNTILITGAVSETPDHLYSSIDAISPSGELIFEYHKQHLIPFGEYIPLKKFLPIKKITHGLIDYTPGAGTNIFTLNEKLQIRPLICYESVFASEAATNNADLFLNITNNAWYGNSAGPYQHFYIGKFRAIENGIALITSANNGISGVIDPVGRILSKTNLNDVIALDSKIPQKIEQTIFYKLKYLGTIITMLIVIFLRITFTRYN